MYKILAISHAYVEPFTRVGLISTSIYPDFEFIVVLPECVVNKDPKGYKRLVDEGYKVVKIKTYLNFHHSVRFYSIYLLRLLRKEKPDIIFINNEPWSSTAFQIVLLCKILNLKTKIIVYTSENLERKYPFPFNYIEKYVLKAVNLVLTVTKSEGRKILTKKGYKGKVDYLPLSVDTKVFTPQNLSNFRKKILGNFNDYFIIGYVGRIVKEKGLYLLIKLASTLNFKFKILIIGKGSYEKELKYIIKKFCVEDKIILINYLDYSSLPDYMNCIDVLVLPSITTSNWKEQFGRVLIEAMACGVAVVGSSSGEIPEVIGDGGLVFEENNVDDLKDKILLLYNNENLRKELAKKGRLRVETNYSRTIINQKTYNIYKSLLNEDIN